VADPPPLPSAPATTRPSSLAITPTSAPSLARHAFLGIVPDVTAAESTVGVLIAGTVPDSPAARAGVNAGDLLVQMNERPLHRLADLDGFIRAAHPGDSCRLQLWRGKSQLEITATFGETLDHKIGGGPR
jgi:S1-C subfamily serine protease